MKEIKVNSNWIKTQATVSELKELVVKHLGAKEEQILDKTEEELRKWVGTVWRSKKIKEEYGEEATLEFEGGSLNKSRSTTPVVNPFGVVPRKKRSTTIGLTGPYFVTKCGLRAPEGDKRWELWSTISKCTSFEELREAFKGMIDTKWTSTGKLVFTTWDFVKWSEKRGWIRPGDAEIDGD